MQTDFIVVSEYCQKCHIDPSFILLLEEGGLIDVRSVEDKECLLAAQLLDLERYTRLYYELSINIEGIDAIRHLLDRMQLLQDEIIRLRGTLRIYETKSGGVEG